MKGKTMTNRRILLVIILALAVGGYWTFASRQAETSSTTEAGEEPHGEDHAEEQPDSTVIGAEAAEAAGIKTEAAGGALVSETVRLSGRITLNQNATAQVKARFPGIVREVRKGQGETVNVGDVLATVESNESLQRYAVTSPIEGVVLARNTNVGDVAGETPLFTVADVSVVWAEFHVFPRDIDRIVGGQKVRVTSFEGGHSGEAPIAVVLPLAETSSQTVIARVSLPNPQGLWRSGMTVRGDVVINEKDVPLAVKTSAIQRMEGKTVVFVRAGERFSMRPIKIGASDGEWTEVRDGLQPGDSYVTDNSFIIKADIGKAGAEHED